jgi:hypothetical protein
MTTFYYYFERLALDEKPTISFYCQNPACGKIFKEDECSNWDPCNELRCAPHTGAICRKGGHQGDPSFDIHCCPECNTCALTVSLLDELPLCMPPPPLRIYDVDPYAAMSDEPRAALQKEAMARVQCTNCDQFGHEEEYCDALPPHPRIPCGICDRVGHYEESCEALPPHLRA